MSTFSPFASSRSFQVWEYQVSHGRMLIRSPREPASSTGPEHLTNLDIDLWGVVYFELPSCLHGVEIAIPTREEVERIGVVVEKPLQPAKVVVLRSANHRFFVVADGFTVKENEWDIFESPIEFRSHFRAK
jgi:hypothetical protein